MFDFSIIKFKRNMWDKFLIIVRLFVGVSVISIGMPVLAEVPTSYKNQIKDIESLLQKQVDTNIYPGMSVSIIYKDQVLIEKGFGFANIEWGAKATSDTVFEIGSITKSFTGIAVAQLVEAKKISLDDPIVKFIPNYSGHAKNISIRHLLTHTSGIINFTQIPAVYKLMHPNTTRDEVVALFKDLPLNFKQGEQFEYSNSGIYLLGIIIEKVSKLSYSKYIKENILKPFGMTRSGFQNHQKLIPKRAQGYISIKNLRANAPPFNPVLSFSAGGLISTIKDMQRYIAAIHMEPGKLTPFIKDQIFRPMRLTDGSLLNYTLGCQRISNVDGHRKYWHSGATTAFSSHFAYYPDDKLSIVILTNQIVSNPSPLNLEQKIAKIIF